MLFGAFDDPIRTGSLFRDPVRFNNVVKVLFDRATESSNRKAYAETKQPAFPYPE